MPGLVIACDFDGTITCRDTLDLLVRAYGERSVWDALEPDLQAGRVSVEHAMQTEFATVRVEPDVARAHVRTHAGVRDGFDRCVAWARQHDVPFVVISNGFATVIEDFLTHIGFADLPFYAHDIEFGADGSTIVWTPRGEQCPLCRRPCKRHHLEAIRGDHRVVYVGDGISDRCVAQAADVIYARDGLAEYLTGIGVPFVPFHDFHQLTDDLSRIVDAP